METTMNQTVSTSFVSSKSTSITKTKTDFWEKAEFNRFGIIAFTLALVACTSGIVAGLFVDGSSLFQMILMVAPTMFTLCMILAVAPIKVIIGAGAAALVIDLCMMMFSIMG